MRAVTLTVLFKTSLCAERHEFFRTRPHAKPLLVVLKMATSLTCSKQPVVENQICVRTVKQNAERLSKSTVSLCCIVNSYCWFRYKGLKKELTDDGTPVPSHGAKATELGRAQVPKPLPKKIEDDVGGESKLGAAFKLLKEDVLLIVFATLFSLGSTGLSLLSPQFSARIFDILAERNVSALPFGGNISLVSVEEGERISAHVVAQSFFIEEDSVGAMLFNTCQLLNCGSYSPKICV